MQQHLQQLQMETSFLSGFTPMKKYIPGQLFENNSGKYIFHGVYYKETVP